MEFTGERYLPDLDIDSEISIFHLQRYKSILDICKNKIVLDAASGEGYGTKLISSVAKEAYGIDIDNGSVELANINYGSAYLKYINSSVEELPFEDNFFDLVVSFETIEHVSKEIQDKFLSEIKRVLKPEGILIISSPDRVNYSEIPNFSNPFHVCELSKDEFVVFLEQKFSNISLYYQGILCNSYIKGFEQEISKISKYIELRESDDTLAEYVIAVCSNRQISENISSVVLDSANKYYKLDREIKTLKERIGNPNKIIEQKENYINEQRELLNQKNKEVLNLNAVIEQKEGYIKEEEKLIKIYKTFIEKFPINILYNTYIKKGR